jgi:hypothetical protein
VIRRRARSIPERAITESLIVIDRFLEQSEEVSQRALARATTDDDSAALVRPPAAPKAEQPTAKESSTTVASP